MLERSLFCTKLATLLHCVVCYMQGSTCQILVGAAEPCSLLRKVAAFNMHLEIGVVWLALAC